MIRSANNSKIRSANNSNDEGSWDVIVIGAGPAGTASAITVANRGLSVLLLDSKKFPRHKVCGGCLNQVSISMLQQLIGREHCFWKSSTPLNSFSLHHAGRTFSIPTPTGLAVERSQLDQCLVNVAVDNGVAFWDGTAATLGPIEGNRRLVNAKNADKIIKLMAKVVVVAGGLNSRCVIGFDELSQRSATDSRIGVETTVPLNGMSRSDLNSGPRSIRMAVGSRGYVGITELPNSDLHVAASVDRFSLKQHGPRDTVNQILKESGFGLECSLDCNWHGTPSLTARAKRLAGERVFLVGDSACYVEPFTGEGIRWALQSGIGVAPYVEQACDRWKPTIVPQWERWYQINVGRSQRTCRRIARLLKNPTARWLAHQALRFQPGLANVVVKQLNGLDGA